MLSWSKIRWITAIAVIFCACIIAACGGGGADGSKLAAPTGVSATAGDAQVVINWNAVDGADSYVIYSSDAPDIAAEISKSAGTVTEIDVPSAPYTHTGLTNGTTYYYAVAGVNADGVGALSEEVSATPQVGLPSAPTGLAVTIGNKQLTLNWDAVGSATGYKVYWNTTAGIDTNAPHSETTTTNSLAQTGLSNLNTYYYRVAATNAAGEGPLSEEKSGTPVFGGNELTSIRVSTAEDGFGYAVAVDGDTAIVGAPHYNGNKGSAFVYRYANGTWTNEAELTPSAAGIATTNGTYGKAVAINGNRVIVGNPTGDGDNIRSGVAVVFMRTGTSWAKEILLKEAGGSTDDRFGLSVGLSPDYAVVGIPQDDSGGKTDNGAIMHWPTSTWVAQPKVLKGINDNDQFGYSVAVSGSSVVIGVPRVTPGVAGEVYIASLTGAFVNNFYQGSTSAANDWFGASVAVDGEVAIVGSPSNGTKAGSAIIYRYSSGTWTEEKVVTPSSGYLDDQFGASVAISGNFALVGARKNDDKATDAGAAFVYKYSGTAWTEEAKLLASDGAGNDQFGQSVGIDGDLIVIGATDPSGAGNVGAVYFY